MDLYVPETFNWLRLNFYKRLDSFNQLFAEYFGCLKWSQRQNSASRACIQESLTIFAAWFPRGVFRWLSLCCLKYRAFIPRACIRPELPSITLSFENERIWKHQTEHLAFTKEIRGAHRRAVTVWEWTRVWVDRLIRIGSTKSSKC